jgi:hypothetical protein
MFDSVCLCGSARFLAEFRDANLHLTARGLSVMSMAAVDEDAVGMVKSSPSLKTVFDLVHLNKILMTDCIVVVGDGYIGESTAREIVWANMQGKGIYAVRNYVGARILTNASEKTGDWFDLAAAIREGYESLSTPSIIATAQMVLDKAGRAL